MSKIDCLINLFHIFMEECDFSIYASPTSGEAYRDRRLTTNFEL